MRDRYTFLETLGAIAGWCGLLTDRRIGYGEVSSEPVPVRWAVCPSLSNGLQAGDLGDFDDVPETR